MITMLLGGLWHGAGWTFVAWGALHGALVVLNHAWRTLSRRLGFKGGMVWQVCGWALTMFTVTIAWVFFRADTFAGAQVMLIGMSGWNDVLPALGWVDAQVMHLPATGERVWRWIIGVGLVAVLMPNIYQIMRRYRPALGLPDVAIKWVPIKLSSWRPNVAWALGAGALTVAALLMLTQVSEFLYFRF